MLDVRDGFLRGICDGSNFLDEMYNLIFFCRFWLIIERIVLNIFKQIQEQLKFPNDRYRLF